MARNYFTDVVGATKQAFEEGQAGMEQFRQRRGQSQAARSLARGDVEGAKRAFGEAGMVEQVDTLAERQRQQREAQAEAARQAEQTAYEREQASMATNRKNALDQMEWLGNAASALRQIPMEQRDQARSVLLPAVQAIGFPPEVMAQLQQSDLSDQTLDMFVQAMGAEAQKLAQAPEAPAGFRELQLRAEAAGLVPGTPEYQAFFMSGGRQAAQATAGMTPYQAAQLSFREEEAAARREEKAATAEAKREANRQTALKSIGQLAEGIGLIDRLTTSPAFEKMYGKQNALRYAADLQDVRTLTTPKDVIDSIILLEQVTGQAFLGGVQQMRGLGPLSEREGLAVQRAMTRLGNRLLTPKEARTAAQEFKSSLQRLIQSAAQEGRLSEAEVQSRLGITQTGGQRDNFVTRPGASGAPAAFSGVIRQGAPAATRRPPRVVSIEEE